MPVSIGMDGEILEIELSGTLTNLDLTSSGEQIAELESSLPVVPHRTIDLRPVTRLEIDFSGVVALAKARQRLEFRNSFKTAMIAPEIVQFGFARMFQTLNDHPQIVIAIFGDAQSALEWLRRGDSSPPAKPWQPRLDWIRD